MPALPLTVIADENMPALAGLEAVTRLQRLPGRRITREQVREADVLLVRSVTRVDEALLAGSRVRFVGSATIGTDHLDMPWLAAAGIQVSHAPGCNAMAVAEYVLQALLQWLCEQRRQPADIRVGVLGCGNVGSRVAALLRALGAEVLCCDPPRARQGDQAEDWQPLAALLECDVLTLHVPLISHGPDRTVGLVGPEALARSSRLQLLINTCRGGVLDETAWLAGPPDQRPALVLDVWEGEPAIKAALFRQVRSGSPHVAGYSVEGKWRGSAMVCEALARWSGLTIAVPPPEVPARVWTRPVVELGDVLALLRDAHDLRRDHAALATALATPDPQAAFDDLRRRYPPRYEMAGTGVQAEVAALWHSLLSALGVRYG